MLTVPYIFFAPTSSPRAYGDCSPVSAFGGLSQIRIRASLIRGTHSRMVPDAPQEGRNRHVDDVFLHELIHQWQQEITGRREVSYHGHGSDFRDRCNAIGQKLGVPPVGLKPRGGRYALPPCNHWPHNVRPQGYYLGAVVEGSRDETALEAIVADQGVLLPLGSRTRLSEVEAIAAHALRVLTPPEIEELIALLESGRAAALGDGMS
jgi:hypothetical protein